MALHELEADLKAAEQTLNHWQKNFGTVAQQAYSTETEYEIASQAAYDEIAAMPPPEGQKPLTVDAIKAKAFLKCEQKYREYRQAKSDLVVANKIIGIAETTLTSIQTRAGLSRIESGLSGYRT